MAAFKEATVLLAKCKQTSQTFGIRTEKRSDGNWYCNWAFRLKEHNAKNEGYTSTSVSGTVKLDDEYPGCPYCGSASWFCCGSCGQITCWSTEELVTCKWCNERSNCHHTDQFNLDGKNI
ncbi:MAG: hypothetical protein J6K72_10140 [Clostridia bacterium]|nr:hypothetical protein [Clostridia bacterium]